MAPTPTNPSRSHPSHPPHDPPGAPSSRLSILSIPSKDHAGVRTPLRTALHLAGGLVALGLLLVYPWASIEYYRRATVGQYPLSMRQVVPPCQKQDRCVFIVSLGRSGSTALMDAMNQMPGVYVRGENWNMMQHLYNIDQIAQQMSDWTDASLLRARAKEALDDGSVLGVRAEKRSYEEMVAAGNKPAWHNEFQKGRHACAAAAWFKNLYGYDDFRDHVVGFKEIRYAENLDGLLKRRKDAKPWQADPERGRETPGPYSPWEQRSYHVYERYLDFLRGLCHDSKVVFNMRRKNDDGGQGFYLGRGALMKELISWMDRYRKKRGKAIASVVYYEDMFDGSANKTLAHDLAKWLGVWRPEAAKAGVYDRVRFDRVPKI